MFGAIFVIVMTTSCISIHVANAIWTSLRLQKADGSFTSDLMLNTELSNPQSELFGIRTALKVLQSFSKVSKNKKVIWWAQFPKQILEQKDLLIDDSLT